MLTANEKKVLRLLMSSLNTDYSINQIAKRCHLAPNGALKILRKFEKEGILKPKKIANIISYRLDLNNDKTSNILELALISELQGRIRYRLKDFQELKSITESCIIFGSYANLKKEPNDLDVLFILNNENYKEYRRKLADISPIIPVKVHDMVQTEQDLKENIIKNDKVIMEILLNGVVLWGYKTIVKIIQNANEG